jgi:hypothetical protein
MTEPFTLSSEPLTAKRQWLISDPIELLIEHPMADRKRVLEKELPDTTPVDAAASHSRCH